MLKPPNITKCKSCGAEIFFGQSGKKFIPLNTEPVPYIDPAEGMTKTETLFTMGGTPFPAVTGDDIPDYVEDWRYGYRSHFATCPAAREHRKPQRAATDDRQQSLWERMK